MKRSIASLFAVLCLMLSGAALAGDLPASATADAFDAFTAEQLPAETNEDCDPAPAVNLGDQDPTFMASNNCSVGCSSNNCQGVPRGNPCYLGGGRGWGSCNLYLGYQCSDGTGWDCRCYAPGGAIP